MLPSHACLFQIVHILENRQTKILGEKRKYMCIAYSTVNVEKSEQVNIFHNRKLKHTFKAK